VERLSPLEVAGGIVTGTDPLPRDDVAAEAPAAALEAALLAALSRRPCVVSFSGGRDSSVVLAAATVAARRHGLPLPVPVTLRFPGHEASAESSWQELVVRHLGLDDWIRLDRPDLDLVGPAARQVLLTHGLLWPFNAHFHGPIFAAARGGSALTGIGGDELFGPSRWWSVEDVLTRRRRPRARDVLALGLAVSPRRVRRRVTERRLVVPFPWLRPEPRAELTRRLAAAEADEPLSWRRRFAWRAAARYLRVGTAALAALAADDDVDVRHPFLDRGFVRALGALPADARFRVRDDAMRGLFGELLPDPVLARRSKASFDSVFWNDASREFAARWTGAGLDESIVDRDALLREWRSDTPSPRTFTLLQSVWLATEGRERGSADGVEQRVDSSVR
jgi:asparagine synthetase B (glutamine-hydrolysing)